MNAACLRPIVAWLRRDPHIALWLTSRWRGARWRPGQLLRALPTSLRTFDTVTPVAAPLAGRMHFDLYMSPDMQIVGARRARKRIHLFHGVSFKGASISPQALAHDLLFLFGEYQRRRDALCAGLLAAGYELTPPEGGFYVWVRSPLADDVAFCRAAAEHHLLLVPGSGFGTPGWIRLAFSNTPVAVVERSLPAFARVLEQVRA